MKRSPIQWFKNWEVIIKREKEVSRVALSELSGASLWIIRGLQKDFLDWSAYIIYENNRFKLQDPSNSLSHSLFEQEKLIN